MGFTNKGFALMLGGWYRGDAPPANWKVALCTSATVPGPDTNSLSDLVEIDAGNGYTAGGKAVARNSTDFDTLSEDDTADIGKVQIKDMEWVATGGSLPATGGGARYAVLLDPTNQVHASWDLQADLSVTVNQTLRAKDLELRLSHP